MTTVATSQPEQVAELCRLYLRLPEWPVAVSDGVATFVFDPPLSPAEEATLADLATMTRFGVTLTLAEWTAIKADAAGLKAYLGVASPTAAQTAAATKAIIRVLGTIVRS